MRSFFHSVIASLFVVLCALAAPCFAADAADGDRSPVADTRIAEFRKQLAAAADPPDFRSISDQIYAPDPPVPHVVHLLEIGDDALLARIHLIRQARKSVYVQTFIWSEDETGRYLFRELLLAARRGVKVKLLLDQPWSNVDTWNSAYASIASPNVEIKFYNPLFEQAQSSKLEMVGAVFLSFRTLNRRMHNKLFVVDDEIAITGGRNVEDKYFDRDPRYTFRDRDILIIGPVVKDMVRSFHSYWDFERSIPIEALRDVKHKIGQLSGDEALVKFIEAPVNPMHRDVDKDASDPAAIAEKLIRPLIAVSGRVSFYADAPGKRESDEDTEISSTSTGIAEIVAEAGKSVVIQTPYLIFRREALKLMKKVRKKHPDFHAIAVTNSLASTDNIVVYSLAMKQRKRLIKDLKFHVFEFKPLPGDVEKMVPRYRSLIAANGKPEEPMVDNGLPVNIKGTRIGLHAKSFVVDDRIAWVGSHNFDPRSASFNTELAVAIRDEAVAAALKRNILGDAQPQNSWAVAPRKKIPLISHFSGLIGSISQRLPVLDIWPFRYTTNYELREGKTALPYGDPGFHDHYESVGDFPGINLSPKTVQTYLIGVMGGFAVPLM
ncbi:MAG: phospholipase D family protein [Gammaproteobacteria bacterium]|nr:phospholipase D family protein [Gammaproteobacteria bacterium]